MFLILLVAIIGLILFLVRRHYSYWKRLGVPGPEPVPILGNLGKILTGKVSQGDIYEEIYRNYEGHSFVGLYRFTTPCLLVRDPDFIKNIFLRDFKYFQNNDLEVDKEIDPIFGRNPFVLKGAEWKTTRQQLTPCFTSGKMKGMFPLLEKSAIRMMKYVEDETKNCTCLEARELCVRFTLENVAYCAFGIEGKCFDEQCSKFKQLADEFFDSQSLWQKIKFTLLSVAPSLFFFIKVRLISREVHDKLITLVTSTMEYRKKHNIVRNDFLDSIIQLSKTTEFFTEVDIAAHAASFFGDGFETSSRVMSFLIFEIAMNPEVQQKLREEINECLKKTDGELTYECIQDMVYLDMCLRESLRKYPVISQLGKKCTERYTYTPTDPQYKNISVTVEPGTSIILPVGALQNDPKYFKDPEKFIPERFSSKENYNRYTYFPFGEGQRECLGKRFGTTQIKIGVAHLVKNFQLTVDRKTQLPLKFDPLYFLISAVGGLWINVRKIE
nr:probable cytochrome P450 6a13 [Leptinotarsa decemlineata]